MTDDAAALEATRTLVLAGMGRERAQQLRYIQTIRDAAMLAGEQVQDVRLDLMENPPNASTHGVFIDILLSLALGPVSSAAIKQLTSVGTRAVLSLRFPLAKKNGVFSLVPYTIDGLKTAQRFVDQRRRIDLAAQREHYEYWSKIAEHVGGSIKETTQERILREGAKPQSKVGGDSASVAVRRAALSFARLQERAIERTFGGL
jgi:hypothetical protein